MLYTEILLTLGQKQLIIPHMKGKEGVWWKLRSRFDLNWLRFQGKICEHKASWTI